MTMRSHCPTNFGLEHFGDKWSLLIVRDLMFKGKRHYNEFLEAGESVSTSVLGDKLRQLEEGGIIDKRKDNIKKSRIRYSLTKKGIALLPLMVEIIIWSGQYDIASKVDKDFLKKAKSNREDLLLEITRKLQSEHIV